MTWMDKYVVTINSFCLFQSFSPSLFSLQPHCTLIVGFFFVIRDCKGGGCMYEFFWGKNLHIHSMYFFVCTHMFFPRCFRAHDKQPTTNTTNMTSFMSRQRVWKDGGKEKLDRRKDNEVTERKSFVSSASLMLLLLLLLWWWF